MRWKMSFESQQSENLPKQSLSHWYWSMTLSIPGRSIMVILCNKAAEIVSHYSNLHFKYKVQCSNYILMRQPLFVQHMQKMSHRCRSVDMVKVRCISGCEEQDVLVGKHDECDPSSRDTKRQQVLGTSSRTDWLVSTVCEISLCQCSAHCANTGPLTLLFFPHSIKMQSVWLIVVSCALRQDHHQLFRPFTWCWTLITMKVIEMPICSDVYTCCRHGQAA